MSDARAEDKTTAGTRLEVESTAVKVPDLVFVITAYRAWRVRSVQGNARLFALGLDVLWEPRQKAEAECRRLPSLPKPGFSSAEAKLSQHEAPSFCCHCGFWGFKSVENLLLALPFQPDVIGKVSLWGRVVETENGYRAQYAYPEEVWACGAGFSVEQLGLTYDVPVNDFLPSPAVADRWRRERETHGRAVQTAAPARPNLHLTQREVQIVQLLAEGKTNKEVADSLNLARRTVENIRAQVLGKLGLRSFAELIRYAIRKRIIGP